MFCFDGFENIATYPIALYMRQDFPLKEQVNEIVQLLLESGFFVKWQNDNQVDRKRESDPGPVPLTITHVSLLFFFIGLWFDFIYFNIRCRKFYLLESETATRQQTQHLDLFGTIFRWQTKLFQKCTGTFAKAEQEFRSALSVFRLKGTEISLCEMHIVAFREHGIVEIRNTIGHSEQ